MSAGPLPSLAVITTGHSKPTVAMLDALARAAASFEPGTADEERAGRRLVDTHDTCVITDDQTTAWDVSRYDGSVGPTVTPPALS